MYSKSSIDRYKEYLKKHGKISIGNDSLPCDEIIMDACVKDVWSYACRLLSEKIDDEKFKKKIAIVLADWTVNRIINPFYAYNNRFLIKAMSNGVIDEYKNELEIIFKKEVLIYGKDSVKLSKTMKNHSVDKKIETMIKRQEHSDNIMHDELITEII